MMRANDDAENGWAEAQWLVANGKAKRATLPIPVLSYSGPIYPCSQCGTPTTGVMCLSCATK